MWVFVCECADTQALYDVVSFVLLHIAGTYICIGTALIPGRRVILPPQSRYTDAWT